MPIAAEVIADSVCPQGKRITTLRLRYPRFIHAEFMTHRAFSRNASSSRAIPVERLIKDVLRDTAMPLHWGKNQPGMQAREEHNEGVSTWDLPGVGHTWARIPREEAWDLARDNAITLARAFTEAGYHKQIVNRLLEPFSHINVLVTSTEWDNFFELRDHPDAQPEIMVLAQEMKKVMAESVPQCLAEGDWHLPYVIHDDFEPAMAYGNTADKTWLNVLIKLSVARCARVSYYTHEGKPPNIEDDLKLYDRLVGARPLHASPAEHQARPVGLFEREKLSMTGNFRGWVQYRKLLEIEMQH